MNTPMDWMSAAEKLGPKEVKGVVDAGLRLAEDVNPTYRALSLILAQQARHEIRCLLTPTVALSEYQRGRVAMVFDLQHIIATAVTDARMSG